MASSSADTKKPTTRSYRWTPESGSWPSSVPSHRVQQPSEVIRRCIMWPAPNVHVWLPLPWPFARRAARG
eukprot:4714034-Prymnesium_polylepis.1